MDPWEDRLKSIKPVLKLYRMDWSRHHWLLCGNAVWSYICSVFSPSEPFLHLIHSHLSCLTHITSAILVNTRSLFVRSFLSVPPITRFEFIVTGVLDKSLLLNWKHTKKRIRKHILRPNHLHFLWGFHTPLSIHPPRPSLHNLIRNRLPNLLSHSSPQGPSSPPHPIKPSPHRPFTLRLKLAYYLGERAFLIQFFFIPIQFKIRSPLKPREGVG